MNEARRVLAMLALFLTGLLTGVWQFVSPWIISFPRGDGGGWTTALWSSIWAGAVVMAVSGLALAIVSAAAINSALRGASRHGQAPEEE